ncbi:tape measure protein [Candidatus Pacearchaeota archaeon]|nr:tape measure protein [Candidatus Pacearchaeota archaeon]
MRKFLRVTRRGFFRAESAVRKFAVSLLKTSVKFTAASAAIIGAAGLAGITFALKMFLTEASKIEDATAAFTPLLGGVKKAKELVEDLNKTAATTPFQFEALSGVAKQLLPVMDGDLKKIIKTIRMLGDTAGGNAQKLDSITRGFTKAMLKGKVDMESLNMIGEAGVPIFKDLAAVMGVEVNAAFFKMISAGKVSTKDLTKAFQKMTSEGGIFFNGMKIASETLTGKISTLKDNIALTAASIGLKLLPKAKKIVDIATKITGKIREWVKANEKLIEQKIEQGIKKIIETGKKLIDIAKLVVKWTKENKKFIPLILEIIAVIGILIPTMTALAAVITVVNVLMTANPIGLIIVAIAALVAGVIVLIRHWEAVKDAFRNMNPILIILLGPIGLLIKAIQVIQDSMPGLIKAWETFKNVMVGVWNILKEVFTIATMLMSGPIQAFKAIGRIKSLFGGGGDAETAESGEGIQNVTPQQQISKTIEERSQKNTAELTIKDQTGRGELTGTSGPGITMELLPSGGF